MRKLIKLLQTNYSERTLLQPEAMEKPNNAKQKHGKRKLEKFKRYSCGYLLVSWD